MIEESPLRLMASLEARVESLLAVQCESRVKHQALQARLDALERQRQAVEAHNAELAAEAEQVAARHRELQARLADAEAARLELAEENRELEEQNRELEAHNQRLQARLEGDEPTPVFQRSHRQGRGLAALIGHHRTAPRTEDEPAEPETPASEAPDTPAQSDLPIGEAPSPQALLEQWYRRYPDTFFKGHTRPLKVGIHEDLAAREPWPEKLVRRALACYVNLPRYLKSVREGAERLDLAGQPAGAVDRGAADHARKKLERLQAERRRKGKPAKRREAKRPESPRGATEAPARRKRHSAPAAVIEPAPRDDEPADQRLQRKLDELLARHNPR
ncbi:ProQ/FINO family protein [Halomonas organivorans]